MKAQEVASMLNMAVSMGADMESLFSTFVHAPLELGATPFECVATASNTAMISTLGVINGLLDDSNVCRIYIHKDKGNVEFRVTAKR